MHIRDNEWEERYCHVVHNKKLLAAKRRKEGYNAKSYHTGSQIAVVGKGELTCSPDGNGSEFTIEPCGEPNAFKFYILHDGMQKLISVFDNTGVPTLVLRKNNKNLQQVLKLEKAEGQAELCLITCTTNDSVHCVTIGEDDTSLILAEQLENSDKQKWKVVQC